MDILQFLVVVLSLILIISSLFLLLIKNEEKKSKYFWIVFIGGMGWLIAFLLRIIPLNLTKSLTLVSLGIDLSDTQAVQAASHNNVLVLIWGPIFAGLFEEFCRYFLISKIRDVKSNYPKGPIILGLGWTLGEIIYIYTAYLISMNTLNIPWETSAWSLVLASLFERFTVSVFHVLMSLIIFQSILEKRLKKRYGLWIAITLHILFDGLIIVWIIFFPLENLINIWTLEMAFALQTLITLIFVSKYWDRKIREKLGSLSNEEAINLVT
ncbi:MAG: hypothetical protein ACTSVB_09355 [Candidatus Heimdallarchaeaceae archaeon]